MDQRTILSTSAAAAGLVLGGVLWTTHTLAKTKGGCTDAQVCRRYIKDGATELDCMDAKACKDLGGKEVPNKAMCAA